MRAAWVLAVCVVAVTPAGVRSAEDSIDKLLAQLKAEEASKRRLAAEGLGKVKGEDRRVLAGLGKALRDSAPAVRAAASAALVGKGAAAVPVLTAVLADGEPVARRAAASALRTLGREGREAVPALAKALKDKDVDLRIHAAAALQAIGPDAKAAIPALIEASRDMGNLGSMFRSTLPSSVSVSALDAIATIDPKALDEAAKKTVPALLEALKGKDGSARMWAIYSFGRLGASANSAIPDLVTMARENDRVSQSVALATLEKIGPEGQVAALELVSKGEVSTESGQRFLGELRFTRLPARAVPSLVKLLENRQATVRVRVVVLLGKMGPQARDAIPALIPLAKDKELLDVRTDMKGDDPLAVAAALAHIGEPALPALTRALGDKDILTRWQAAHALSLMGRKAKPAREVLEKALDDKFGVVALESAAALLRLGAKSEKAEAILLQGLKQESAFLRLLAAQRIGAIGPRMKKAVPALVELLSDENAGVKRAALAAMRDLKQAARPAVPQLARLLKQPNHFFHFQIMHLLGELGPDAGEAVPALIDCLKLPDVNVRHDAAEALGQIGPRAKEAVPALREALKAGSHVRGAAVYALGKIGPPAAAALPDLVGILKDDSEYARAPAARALGEIGPEAREAVPALKKLLDDEKKTVRAWAAFALTRISGNVASYLPTLEEIYHQRATQSFGSGRSDAVEALIALGPPPEAASILIEAAGDQSLGAFPRYNAVRALGKLGKKAQPAIPRLITLLQVNKPGDWNEEAHTAAAEALGNLGPLARDAVPHLKKLLDDDNEKVSQAAAEALKKIEVRKEQRSPQRERGMLRALAHAAGSVPHPSKRSSRSPASTCVPGCTRISATVPARSA